MPKSKTAMASEQTRHLDLLRRAFERHYGTSEPQALVIAPGRVNLMGDHVDYNGLPVLPMALQRHVALLYRGRDDSTVRIASTDPRFSARNFDLSATLEPFPEGDWGNYVKAAGETLVRRFGIETGIDAVVHSDIPVASGLSSSSALVVANALALLDRNDVSVDTIELAELLAEAERYVGTRGGGMDQAICLAARRGAASRIDFNPLRVTAHVIPTAWCFVVGFSLVRVEKSGEAREAYNTRPRECREALIKMTRALNVAGKVSTYPDLLARWDASELVEMAKDVLEENLLRRFRHVVTEGDRVSLAEMAIRSGDGATFGRLMDASHRSLTDDFDVSTPELDEMVEIAHGAGAAGARLTGAGLGGCVVVLCLEDETDGVLQALSERYYAKREPDGGLEDHLFVAEPSAGASVTLL
jgi:galactokinase